jgi:hypothetical protein
MFITIEFIQLPIWQNNKCKNFITGKKDNFVVRFPVEIVSQFGDVSKRENPCLPK